MIRTQALSMLALAALIALDAAADDKKPQTIKGWGTAVDPDNDCKFEEKDGKVTITVPGTNHDLTYVEEKSYLNGPRLVREVEGDFSIQVKVLKYPLPSGNATGKYPFVSAGLLVWNDDKEFFRMERSAVGTPPFAYAAGILNGKDTPLQGTPFRQLPDGDTFVRAERKGKKLTFSVRTADESEWTELVSDSFELPAKLHVGVHAVNTVDNEFKAEFQELEFKQ
jgi:regulation of enolase protein 1 (concanavalin A-like superfamily)